MKTTFASILLLVSALTSQATTYTFNPNPIDLNDLDHHMAYTYELKGLSLGGNITSARLTFTNIYNRDYSAHALFIHLLDTALATPTHTLDTVTLIATKDNAQHVLVLTNFNAA